MKKCSLNKIIFCAFSGYIKWLINTKMIVYVAAIMFVYSYIVLPLLDVSKKVNISIGFLEIFIAIGNSGLILLILPLIFMVLISDFPYLDENSNLIIPRIGKTNWIVAQLIQLFFMDFTYLAFTILISIVLVIGQSQYIFDWSGVTKKYIEINPEARETFIAELLPENLFNQLSLIDTVLHTFGLMFLYLFVIGMIFIISKFLYKKFAGALLSGTIIVLGTILGSIKSELMWLFPMANSVTWIHYTKFLREPTYPICYSYLYYVIVISTLIFLSIKLSRRFAFINME